MKAISITVDNDPGACSITVSSMSDRIEIRGFSISDTVQVTFNWTSVPTGSEVASARLQVRQNASDSAADDIVDLTGTVTDAGAGGTAVAEFILDMSALTPLFTYVLLISLIDTNGFPRTWKGVIRGQYGS